jgi:hypothetical protein
MIMTEQRSGPMIDQAKASDDFGVVMTAAPIEPAKPTKRRADGGVIFPAGVALLPPDHGDHPIYIGAPVQSSLSIGVARQLVAALAGAVAEYDIRQVRLEAALRRAQAERGGGPA